MAQVRSDSGRPVDLDGGESLKIASILKNDNWRLKRELDSRCQRIIVPWNVAKRGKTWPLPADADFTFFGKNIGPRIRETWAGMPWGEEKLSCEERLDRALGTYDWVLKTKPDALVVWTDAYPEARAEIGRAHV